MTLRLEKCHFFQKSVRYLGFIFDRTRVTSDPNKTAAILEYSKPKNQNQLLSFLGLVTFYREHVPNCSKVCEPLFHLTHGEKPFIWGEKEEGAFIQVKNLIAKCLLLSYPEPDQPFIINTDASSVAISGIIYQKSGNTLNLIAMELRLLNSAERNYNTFERELLAIIHTLRKSHYLLYGTEVQVVTNHKALEYLYSLDEVSSRVERWRLFMQLFKIVGISHVKGLENKAADGLSRFTELIMS